MNRENRSSDAPWEAEVGYSRLVKTGPFIYVAGTAAIDAEGHIPESAYDQTVMILRKIEKVMNQVDSGLSHVVRTRMYLTDQADIGEVTRAHGEFFRNIRPVATLLLVAGFIDPRFKVEIEVDAVVTAWE